MHGGSMSSTYDAEYKNSKTSDISAAWTKAAPSQSQTPNRSDGGWTRKNSRLKEHRKKQVLHSNLLDNSCCNYEGDEIQFVQIGMGTHTTFAQNLGGDPIDWSPIVASLIDTLSERRPNHVRGVCAEPIPDIVKKLEHTIRNLPYVCLLKAAIGEFDRQNETILSLTAERCREVMEEMPANKLTSLDRKLQYYENMASLNKDESWWDETCKQLEKEYDILVAPMKNEIDIWSYETLASSLNFVGCEVLLIDAEGHDAQILRSVIRHCKKRTNAWPKLIQFETQGHCDDLEGRGTEWKIIRSLQKEGYLLVAYSNYDTYLVQKQRIGSDARLRSWLLTWMCKVCKKKRKFPYIVRKNWKTLCWKCMTTGRAWNW